MVPICVLGVPIGVAVFHIVAVSGGKDSTALALRLKEVEPRDYLYFCTPTGDELPDMVAHWDRLEELLGAPIIKVTNGTLNGLIEQYQALPNWRQRWCTRVLKIEPCLAFLAQHQPATLYEVAEGIVGEVTVEAAIDQGFWCKLAIDARNDLKRALAVLTSADTAPERD